jgi:3-deoxy-D-manno-octulosonate 8-phosphate phosphatase (KDO 8-P phosphatase)
MDRFSKNGDVSRAPSASHPFTPSRVHWEPLAKRIARIEMLLVDVDGVLTDGRIIYDEAGREVKAFHVRDGSGLKLWRAAGKKAGIITGRSSPIVAKRAAELRLDALVQGAEAKYDAVRRVLLDFGLRDDQACYVGDDVPDLPVLRKCGLAVAVADACAEVVAEAHYVTQRPGGQGAVREVIELILRTQGLWNEAIERFLKTSLATSRVDS